jgi:hypothetical protein
MKKSFIAIMLLTLPLLSAFSQVQNTENQQVIADFITCVKQQNKEELSGKIAYPFKRAYPLPPIRNKQEFQNRYKEIFDDSLINMIVTSKPDKDWTKMGWRGLMLRNGQLWLGEDGRLIAVNYQSVAESKKRAALIDKQKNYIHPSLQQFERPVCFLKTNKFKIRIDDMGNGNYRYASWPVQNKQSDKPDLVMENGELLHEGTGGNHRYEFKNDGYVYSCDVNVLGRKADPPATLTIYKGEKAVLSQPATIAE